MGLKEIFMRIFRRNKKLLNSSKSFEEVKKTYMEEPPQTNTDGANKREEYEKQIKQPISHNQEKMIEEIMLVGLMKNPALKEKMIEELKRLGYTDLESNPKIIDAIEEKGKIIKENNDIVGVAIPGEFTTETVEEGTQNIENVKVFGYKNSQYFINNKSRISKTKENEESEYYSSIINEESIFNADGIELRKNYNKKINNFDQKESEETGYMLERAGVDKVKYIKGDNSTYIDLDKYAETNKSYDLAELPDLGESAENGNISEEIVYKEHHVESMWERSRIGGILQLVSKSKLSAALYKYMDGEKQK